jgi:spermidine/putrescine transport system substrate-binding protein
MLDPKVAYKNFTNYVGYQPPITSIDPQKVLKDGIVPPTLSTALVTQEAYANGNGYLTLSTSGEREWEKTWQSFRSG